MIRTNRPRHARRLIAAMVFGAMLMAGCGQSGGGQVTAPPAANTQAPANPSSVPAAYPTTDPAAYPTYTAKPKYGPKVTPYNYK